MTLELVARFRVSLSVCIEVADANHILECLGAHRARVHAQSPADGAGNSFHPLQTAHARRLSRVGHLLQLCSDSGGDLVSVDNHLVEISAARMDNDAADAAVADEN